MATKPSLNSAQLSNAQFIYRTAIGRGVPPARARELAEAAYRESGLNPNAKGPPVHHSGYGGRRAAGFFQLLSSGYVQRANRMGGVFNPRANLLAILPDYMRYWQQNPRARPGDAAAAVERSGKPGSWYDVPDELIPLGGAAPTRPARAVASGPAAAPPGGMDDGRGAFAAAIAGMVGRGGPDPSKVAQAVVAFRRQRQLAVSQQQAMMPASGFTTDAPATSGPLTGIDDAFYDPAGYSVDEGRYWGKTIGGHGKHGHISFTSPEAALRAIRLAQRMGLRVGENPYTDRVDAVHTKGSDHYARFADNPRTPFDESRLGRAGDFTGPRLAEFMQLAMGPYRRPVRR